MVRPPPGRAQRRGLQGAGDRQGAAGGAESGRRGVISSAPLFRSYLYAPGNDPRKIEKALAAEADAVVLDLEDAVAPNRKEEARESVSEVLRSRPAKPVFVRVNAPGSALAEEDIEAVAGPNLARLRAPKKESAGAVRR